MSSVLYIGSASRKLITAAMWNAAVGSGAFSDIVWEPANGWSVPTADLTTAQLNLLATDLEFLVNQPDGPRVNIAPNGSQAKSSDPAYYAAAQSLINQMARVPSTKMVNIIDNGIGFKQVAAFGTSTVGTSAQTATVGVAATGIAVSWDHWVNSDSGDLDTDPSGSITFNASIRVISSTNPGTTIGQLYRLTFKGQNTATLDPGGTITSDVLGISLMPGDVISVRTYLASGTAYVGRIVYGTLTPNVGFTAASDLTPPGSAAVTSSQGYYFGPSMVLGYPDSASTAKSVGLLGDSIGNGIGETGLAFTKPIVAQGFMARALTAKGGLVNLAEGGDWAQGFQRTAGSLKRLRYLERCNSAVIEYGTNDIGGVLSAATVVEAANLNIASNIRRLGIGKVFITTLLPRTTSTDAWATTTNQTPIAGESERLNYNAWIRAKCPVNPITLAPVAVGTSNALLAGQLGHPINGIFDIASAVESSLNSGFWLPCNRVVNDAVATNGSAIVTSATANFVNTNQEVGGDIGSSFVVFGAGAGGANFNSAAAGLAIWTIQSATQCTVNGNAATTVSAATMNIGVMTLEGTHPSSHAHHLISQVIDTSVL